MIVISRIYNRFEHRRLIPTIPYSAFSSCIIGINYKHINPAK